MIIVTLIVISAFFLGVIGLFLFEEKQNSNNTNDGNLNLTNGYINITAKKAYDMIYIQNNNITIIDVPTSGITRYNDSHLENAIMVDDQKLLPEGIETLYNTKSDILIYDDYGDGIGILYCNKLINQTYGNIYYLDGGFSEWKKQGYPYWSR